MTIWSYYQTRLEVFQDFIMGIGWYPLWLPLRGQNIISYE